MKRYYRDLLLILIISFFVVTFASAEELQCCSDKTATAVHKERPIVRVTYNSKGAEGISQIGRARGVYGGDSMTRPTGKKNSAMTLMTKSASLALVHVTVASLVHLFLY